MKPKKPLPLNGFSWIAIIFALAFVLPSGVAATDTRQDKAGGSAVLLIPGAKQGGNKYTAGQTFVVPNPGPCRGCGQMQGGPGALEEEVYDSQKTSPTFVRFKTNLKGQPNEIQTDSFSGSHHLHCRLLGCKRPGR